MLHRARPAIAALTAVCALAACVVALPLAPEDEARLAALLPADVLLLGEQHDAPAHQRLQRQAVEWLAARGELAALALEMAERGHDTRALPRDASAAQVQQALAWQGAGWPWATYGPVVMAAVRAGVPVLGANLPSARQRDAMRDATLEARLPPQALAEQQRRIREGHCHLLPEAQIQPMTRVQIARDIAMAETVSTARQPGRTVLLVAGNGDVQRALGVPAHLPPDVKSRVISAQSGPAQAPADPAAARSRPESASDADLLWPTPAVPARDYCAEFRRMAPALKPGQ